VLALAKPPPLPAASCCRRYRLGLLALFELLRTVLWTFFFSIFLHALLSLIAPGTCAGAIHAAALAEPVLRPFRRIIPPLGELDLAAVAIILIQALLILLQ
jgi:YggT family protein